MATLSPTTFTELDVTASQAVTLLTRARIRVATTAAPFCSVPETEVWFPMPDGVNAATLPQPTVITNSSPVPANAVAVPPDFDDTDLCYIFQDLVRDSEPVYAEEVNSVYIIPPFVINYSLLGVTRTSISVREYPYELTLPGETVALVTRAAIAIPTYIFYADAGTFATAGQAASLIHSRALLGAAGAFTLTGAANSWIRNYVLAGAAGSYALAGQAAATLYQRSPLAAEAGAFVLQGQDAQWFYGKTLSADAGSFALSGEAAGFIRGYVLAGQAGTYVLTGQAAADGDPFFSSVRLLLPMEGTNGSTTFTDVSKDARTVTVVGNAQISTARFKWGASSGLFDGAGDRISITLASAIGNSDFCLEAWVYIIARSANVSLINIGDANTVTGIILYSTTAGRIAVYAPTFINVIGTTQTIPTGAWCHVAITKASNTVRMFVNGVQDGSGTHSGSLASIAIFGQSFSNSIYGDDLNGNIGEARITVGQSRYTATFTPPTAPFPRTR